MTIVIAFNDKIESNSDNVQKNLVKWYEHDYAEKVRSHNIDRRKMLSSLSTFIIP